MKVFFVLVLFFCQAIFTGILGFEIDVNKQKNYSVVIQIDKATPAEKFAAETLCKYLKASFIGADFRVIDFGNLIDENNVIYIGFAPANLKKTVDLKNLGAEESLIVVKDQSLCLSGGSPRGTLYAVYDFLEKFCGVRYLAFDTQLTPVKNKLELADMSIKRTPAFKFRIVEPGRNVGAEMQSFNKGNSYYVSADKYGYYQRHGMPRDAHALAYYSKQFPVDKPELFALTPKGRAVPPKVGQVASLCLSNPETRDIIWRQMEKYIEEDEECFKKTGLPPAEFYELSLDDSREVCICDTCKKTTDEAGSYAAVVLNAVNDIAGRANRKNSRIKILTLVYLPTLIFPKNVKPAENVLPRITIHDTEMLVDTFAETTLPINAPGNAEFKKIIEPWIRNSSQVAFWDYWNYYSKPVFPYICLNKYFDNMKYYYACRAQSVLVEMEIYTASFYALKYYLALKLMDNPEYDRNLLISDFMSGYYGNAATLMTKYLNYLDSAVAKEAATEPLGRRSPIRYSYLSEDFFTRVSHILDQAEAAVADDSKSLKHVKFERVAVDRCSILFWRKFGAKMPFTKKTVLERIEANQTALIKEFFPTEKQAQEITELNSYIAGESLSTALPEDIAKAENVFDYNTASLAIVVDTRSVRIVNDQDAIGGRAVEIFSKDELVGKTGLKFHQMPFEAGVYNRLTRESGLANKIAKIHFDEKYHLYKIGTSHMTPGSYVYLHWTWQFQFLPTSAYMPTKDSPPYDIYASLKFTGPTYVKNSTRPDGVFVDRIILVRGE